MRFIISGNTRFGYALFLHSVANRTQTVLREDFFTVLSLLCRHPGKVHPFCAMSWVISCYLRFYIYCMVVHLPLCELGIFGSSVTMLVLCPIYTWDLRGVSLATPFDLTSPEIPPLLMYIPLPTSPLSFSNSSNGSVDDQNNVSSSSHPT